MLGNGQQTEEHLQKISANLGDTVIMNCAFDFPDKIEVPYVIHWQKRGVKIPIYIWYDGYPPHLGEGYEGRVSLMADPNNREASLNLTNVRESDQGWYECKVYFLNQNNEQLKNGTFVLLDVHGLWLRFAYQCFTRLSIINNCLCVCHSLPSIACLPRVLVRKSLIERHFL